MKLQIKYNLPSLTDALKIAEQTEEYADVIEVGSLLIYQHGIKSIEMFKQKFPNKEIYADAKISNKGEDSVKMFANAGAKYISVLAGTYYRIIRDATSTAKKYNVHITLDFINSHSLGKSAMEAKTLGAHSILLHRALAPDEKIDLKNYWEQVRGNTDLPIFIKGKINQAALEDIIPLKPQGVVVGSEIVDASDPRKKADQFKNILK